MKNDRTGEVWLFKWPGKDIGACDVNVWYVIVITGHSKSLMPGFLRHPCLFTLDNAEFTSMPEELDFTFEEHITCNLAWKIA